MIETLVSEVLSTSSNKIYGLETQLLVTYDMRVLRISSSLFPSLLYFIEHVLQTYSQHQSTFVMLDSQQEGNSTKILRGHTLLYFIQI